MSNDTDLDRVRAAGLRHMLVTNANASKRQARRRLTPVGTTVLVVSTALLAAGAVTTVVVTSMTESPVSQAGPAVQVGHDFPVPSDAFANDYVIVKSPDELAGYAQVVISGTVVHAEEYADSKSESALEASGRPVILVLENVSVAKGAVVPWSDGTVHLALNGYQVEDLGLDLGDFRAMFPEGTQVVAYVQRVWPRSGGFGGDPDPTDQADAFYMPMSPQGFAVQLPNSDQIDWPFINDVQAGKIGDALPGGKLVGKVS